MMQSSVQTIGYNGRAVLVGSMRSRAGRSNAKPSSRLIVTAFQRMADSAESSGDAKKKGKCPFSAMFSSITKDETLGENFQTKNFRPPKEWVPFLSLQGRDTVDKDPFVERMRTVSRALHQVSEDGEIDQSLGNGLNYRLWKPSAEQLEVLLVDLHATAVTFENLTDKLFEAFPNTAFRVKGTILDSSVLAEDIATVRSVTGGSVSGPSESCKRYLVELEAMAKDNPLGLLCNEYQYYTYIFGGGIQVILKNCDNQVLQQTGALNITTSHIARKNPEIRAGARAILQSLADSASCVNVEEQEKALGSIPAAFAYAIPMTNALAPQ